MTFQVTPKNDFERGIYDRGRIHYDFGDNTSADSEGLEQTHTYGRARSYLASAGMVMQVAPGAEALAPFKDEATVLCEPKQLQVDIQ